MFKKIIIGTILILTGCATSANYEKVVDTWLGSDEAELIRSWGTPSSVYQSGNTKFLEYSSSRQVVIPGSEPNYNTDCYDYGNQVNCTTTKSGGYAGTSYNASCSTRFEINSGKVVGWSFQGNDCRAFAPD